MDVQRIARWTANLDMADRSARRRSDDFANRGVNPDCYPRVIEEVAIPRCSEAIKLMVEFPMINGDLAAVQPINARVR